MVLSVHVVGNIAYLITAENDFDDDDILQVVEIDDNGTFVELGSIPVPIDAFVTGVSGNILSMGSLAFDISDPANIVPLGRLPTSGSPFALEVDGTIGYAATTEGIEVLDLSDLDNIRLIGTFETPGDSRDVKVRGNVVYVADSSTGLRILDIADPTNIVELGFFDTPGSTSALEVVDQFVYLADGTGGLRILDVSDPANAIEVGFFDTEIDARSVHIENGLAYVNTSRVFDIAFPSNIVELGSLDLTAFDKVHLQNDLIYGVDFRGVLRVLDVPIQATGTIQNDDASQVILASVENISTQQLEGNDPNSRAEFQFSVTLDNPVPGGFTLEYFVRDGAFDPMANPGRAELGIDYEVDDSPSYNEFSNGVGTLTFDGTANERLFIDLNAIADEIVEADEFFHIELGAITLSDPNLDPNLVTLSDERPGDRRQQGVILNNLNDIDDDDSLLTLSSSLANPAVPDGQFAPGILSSIQAVADGSALQYSITVKSSNAVQGGFRTRFAAASVGGLVSKSGIVEFLGLAEEEKTFTVEVPRDNQGQPVVDLFSVSLGTITTFGPGVSPGDIVLADSDPLVIVVNDPPAGGAALSITSLVGNEGTGGGTTSFVFSVTLSIAVPGGFDVNYTTDDGSATAISGDYVDNDGTLSFAGNLGEAQSITVQVNQDDDVEAHEFFTVALGAITGLGPGVDPGSITVGEPGEGTIRNDDQIVIAGAGAGGEPTVRVFSSSSNLEDELHNFPAYAPAFFGGVRVAAGDVNGDGAPDIITGAGPGGGPHVRVLDGISGDEITNFFAFAPAFLGGVHLAAADFNGDERAEVIVAADAGGGPHVRVLDLSGPEPLELLSFFAYAEAFLGGVRVAAGDVNGDGTPDIITGPGAGGGPHVRVFSGIDEMELESFFAFAPAFLGGVFVSSADFNLDNQSDIVVAAGAGGGPHVRVLSGADTEEELARCRSVKRSCMKAVFSPFCAGCVNCKLTWRWRWLVKRRKW